LSSPGKACLAGSSSGGSEVDTYLASWLEEQEARHRFLVYETEAGDSPWTRRCIRQADRILGVPAASDDPVPLGVETALLESNGSSARTVRELVLVHPGDGRPPVGTARWLVPRGSPKHHHVRWDRDGDMARLARFLAGRAVGLVLSWGGAKGFAHIGVLKALRVASIPLDVVGGTSMGAILAAGVATDWDFEACLGNYRQAFTRGNPMGDYNLLPLVSFLKGARMETLLRRYFGGNIEDLWIPCFCVSSNLTEGSVETHIRGPLWKALRASGSLVGVFPPVVFGDALHVDGGTLDNLPVTAARELGAGVVIACDLDLDKRDRLEYDAVPSNWEIIKDRYITRSRRLKVPGLVSMVFQATFLGNRERRLRAFETADLCFLSPVRKIRFLDWRAFEESVDIGYRHAKERLEKAGRAWLDPNGNEV
jgi:predicted acylesterase/phospholipase RssA